MPSENDKVSIRGDKSTINNSYESLFYDAHSNNIFYSKNREHCVVYRLARLCGFDLNAKKQEKRFGYRLFTR